MKFNFVERIILRTFYFLFWGLSVLFLSRGLLAKANQLNEALGGNSSPSANTEEK